ncbi:valyl-tRNA synthetase [Galdieria sulphuraria]|uniref:valine--tRNA ligase n=1 Tax=Galdieria sulphuraria TaxID=130081 RepID=M2XAX8_GALSU|nr:valyl-tRNA synthetase [Galdieria sulphuraria]EME27052.1 valyl-tRNA synthetase [Galdieria sulphuraria]|eukprot:XP_005703572.1 valyl-tRNA synthetase [Galdieria sulphuraria]
MTIVCFLPILLSIPERHYSSKKPGLTLLGRYRCWRRYCKRCCDRNMSGVWLIQCQYNNNHSPNSRRALTQEEEKKKREDIKRMVITRKEAPFLDGMEDLWKQPYQPEKLERIIYDWWESSGYFLPNNDSSKTPFTISMPPPNITGALHMGHAVFVTLQDILVRYYRMQQYPVCWIPGTDHASIATQTLVERMLKAQQGKTKEEVGREKFLELAWQWKEEKTKYITQQLRAMGSSCDWSRERFTMDEQLSKAVEEAFIRLYEKGYIYRGHYLVNWSPLLQTAVSDLEVEWVEEDGFLYYFKYCFADNPDEYIPIATTRPETILGDVAICVHPQDVRYKNRIEQQVIVPYIGRRVSVIADEAVDPNFGTGALKITPAHDHLDYEIGKRHGLELINIMNWDATMNDNCGCFQGLDRMECRLQLWNWMESQGLVLKKEPYRIRVPRSQRSGEIVEPLISLQWFVKTASLALPAMQAIQSGEIRIIPSRFEKNYLRWMENIHDWCISRQLWWGHSLPVWYLEDMETDSMQDSFVVARSEKEALDKVKAKYPNYSENIRLRRETDVLDTWFSSGLWPFAILGWPNTETLDYQKFYPNSVMETGYDILFFWVARMIMLGYELTGKPPFHTVYLHGLVRDAQGQKMSKTLGNVLDPLQVMADYGTDALRLALVTNCHAGQDISFSLEKVVVHRNFANKLWNIGRFIVQNIRQRYNQNEWIASYQQMIQNPWQVLHHMGLAEKFILYRLYELIAQVSGHVEEFDLASAGNRIVEFIWDDFADWYIEIAKTRWQERTLSSDSIWIAALLIFVWDYCLRLLHPFMPFITEAQWQWLIYQCGLPKSANALIITEWPQMDHSLFSSVSKEMEQSISSFESFRDIVRAIRKIRGDYGVAPSQKIKVTIYLKEEAKNLAMVLKEECYALKVLAKTENTLDIELNDSVFTTPQEGHDADALEEYRDGFIYVLTSPVIITAVGLRGNIDPHKELERLTKQHQKLQKEIATISSRLDNPKFLQNAPAQVVDENKQFTLGYF